MSFGDNVLKNVEAIIHLENLIQKLQEGNADIDKFETALNSVDPNGNIFNATRIFFVITELIERHVNKDEGFTEDTKARYYQTLIYFTDYALLRLICISMSYDKKSNIVKRLRNNSNLISLIRSTGLVIYFNQIKPSSD